MNHKHGLENSLFQADGRNDKEVAPIYYVPSKLGLFNLTFNFFVSEFKAENV